MSVMIHLLKEDLIALISDHYDVSPEDVDIRIARPDDESSIEIRVSGAQKKIRVGRLFGSASGADAIHIPEKERKAV